MQRYQKGIDFIKSFSDICQSHLNPKIPGPQEPDPPVLGLPLFRAPPRPHSRGTAAARLSCCRQTPELVQLLLSTCCMQSSELCVGLKKRQYPLGLPAVKGPLSILHPRPAYPPPPTHTFPWSEYPLSLCSVGGPPGKGLAPGADPHGGSRPLVT